MAKKRSIFYGWYIVGAGTTILAIYGASFTYGLAAFFVPLAATLGVGRGLLSTVFSFARLETGLLGPIEGYLIDRFGPRKVMLVGTLLFGGGFLFLSRIDSLVQFFLAFGIMALGGSMAGFLPVSTAVQNWFSRRRGLATGISAAGVNIGGAAVAVVALAITSFGWRSTAVFLALLIWGVVTLLSLTMRHRPQNYGYLPDGDRAETRDSESAEATPGVDGVVIRGTRSSADFTARQAIKTRAFWLIATAHAFSLLIIGAVTIHTIPALMHVGVSYEKAALMLSIVTIMAVAGRLLGGYLGDRLGCKPVLTVCFIMMALGLVVLAIAQNFAQATIFALLYGLAYGARAPLLIALRADYFGPRNFGTIMGFSQLVMMLGTFLGPVIAGFAYDIQGSYTTAFMGIAALGLIGILLVVLLKPPEPPHS